MIHSIQTIHFMMSLLLVLHSYSWKWKDQLHLSFKWRLSMTARASQFECSSPRLQLITMWCLVSCKDIVSIVHNTGESWTEPWIWPHVAVTHLPCPLSGFRGLLNVDVYRKICRNCMPLLALKTQVVHCFCIHIVTICLRFTRVTITDL